MKWVLKHLINNAYFWALNHRICCTWMNWPFYHSSFSFVLSFHSLLLDSHIYDIILYCHLSCLDFPPFHTKDPNFLHHCVHYSWNHYSVFPLMNLFCHTLFISNMKTSRSLIFCQCCPAIMCAFVWFVLETLQMRMWFMTPSVSLLRNRVKILIAMQRK